jgi:hypothetical protein
MIRKVIGPGSASWANDKNSSPLGRFGHWSWMTILPFSFCPGATKALSLWFDDALSYRSWNWRKQI